MRLPRSLVLSFALFAAIPVSPLAAQSRGFPADAERFSLALQAGVILPTADLSDGTSFRSGSAFGLEAAYWPFERAGIQAMSFVTKKRAVPRGTPTASSYFDPKIRGLAVGPVLRHPVSWSGLSWVPFVSVGVGAHWIDWANLQTGRTESAAIWTLAGGLDLRLESNPRGGLLIEARDLRSDYRWHGFENSPENQDDLLLSVGLSLHM